MNLEPIKDKLVYYLDKEGVSPDFLFGGRDMVLDALNEARLKAEQAYAFELNKRILVIPAVTGVCDWVLADDLVTSVPTLVRNIKKLYAVTDTGGLRHIPLDYYSLLSAPDPTSTINMLVTPNDPMQEQKAAIIGNRLHIFPANSTPLTLRLDAYAWMKPYGAYTDVDWMTTHGHNYLFWAALQILNHRAKEFVPRQEGNLVVNEETVQRQLAGLISWDNQIRNSYFNALP
jgi:hypothetical protein